MAYSAAQQEKINKAQLALDTAKQVYQGWVSSYNEYANGITPCYDGDWYDAGQAASWFNPQKTHCTRKGACTGSDKNQCQAFVNTLNTTTIPGLRSAYSSLTSAQVNFDKVLQEVAAETSTDPGFILQQQQQVIQGEVAKKKWITFGIIAIAILIIAYLVYRKA